MLWQSCSSHHKEQDGMWAVLNALKLQVTAFARSRVHGVLGAALTYGSLAVTENGSTKHFGDQTGSESEITITVLNEDFWLRIIQSSNLGLAEAYMAGEILVSDLPGLMEIYLRNRRGLVGLSLWVTKACDLIAGIAGINSTLFGQTLAMSKSNVEAGYDCSNALFQAFLSEEMMYSCPYWSAEQGGPWGDMQSGPMPGDLEVAQKRKLHMVIQKARITGSDKVLEFGSGWGGFAIEVVRTTGCIVHTITLSVEQKKLAEERIRAAGLEKQITVYLLDYRNIPSNFKQAFDVVISIEMLEHVGPSHYETFFSMVDYSLKAEGGRAVITSSTMPDTRYVKFQRPDFARKYFWPNGTLPSITALIKAANTASNNRLLLESAVNHGPHYGRALREWGRRYERNITADVVKLIQKDQPQLADTKVLEAFHRKWKFFFQYAAAGYSSGYVNCHMMTFLREDVVSIE